MTQEASQSNENIPVNATGVLAKIHNWLTSPGGRLVRYVLVLAIVGVAVYYSLAGWFQVCEVVDSEQEGVTSTCSGPDLTSAGVLASVVFVLLLLWPDLSEFSAFGVTLKRLVQQVDGKVTQTRDRAERIDATTIDARGRIEILQSTLTAQGTGISERLALIEGGLTNLNERGWQYSAEGRGSATTAIQLTPRWDDIDTEKFVNACNVLLGESALDDAVSEVRESVSGTRIRGLGVVGVYPESAALVGLVLELFSLFRADWDRRHGDDEARLHEISQLLRSIEQMVLALLAGKNVNRRSLDAAAGLLLTLHRR